MKNKPTLPKKDIIVILFCASFLFLCLGAIGSTGRYRQKMVLCKLNQKKMTTGSLMYANDNGKLLPKIGSDHKQDLWVGPLSAYISKDEVRYCPSTEKNTFETTINSWSIKWIGSSLTRWIWAYHVQEPEQGSYAYNWWLYSDETSPKAWKTAYPPNSNNVPIFIDSKWVDTIPDNGQTCPANLDLNVGGSIQSINAILLNRHRNLTNVAFVDGHVDSVELKNLWSLKWHKEWIEIENMTREDGSPIYPEK